MAHVDTVQKIDSAGKVSRFRHRIDTHQQWKAHSGA